MLNQKQSKFPFWILKTILKLFLYKFGNGERNVQHIQIAKKESLSYSSSVRFVKVLNY